MPTYEFACPAGHHFTRFYRKMSDAVAELPCPECGAVASRKISGGAGLLFKGSGFYITDYGKDGKKSAAPANAGEGASGDAKAGDSAPRDAGAAAADTGSASSSAGVSKPAKAKDAPAASSGSLSGSSAKKKGSPSE